MGKKARKRSFLPTFTNMQMNTCFLKNTEQKSTKQQQQPAPCSCKRAFLNICPAFYQSPDPLSTERSLHFWATGPSKDHFKAGTARRAELVLTPDAIFIGPAPFGPKRGRSGGSGGPGEGEGAAAEPAQEPRGAGCARLGAASAGILSPPNLALQMFGCVIFCFFSSLPPPSFFSLGRVAR